ncbi:hypothetical protein MKW92_033471 [Papaver armeniacum]|nr:hypothetical protein MKW92_033471 [Papaver armeniacum]
MKGESSLPFVVLISVTALINCSFSRLSGYKKRSNKNCWLKLLMCFNLKRAAAKEKMVRKREKSSGDWEEMVKRMEEGNEMQVQKVSSYSHRIIESVCNGPFLWNSYARIMKDYVC